MESMYVEWLEDNETILYDYVGTMFPDSISQQELLESELRNFENCKATKTILEDFQTPNDIKYKQFLNKFDKKSLIVSVIADRGEGKTAFCVKILEDLAKKGHKIYALYPFPCLPFMEAQVYDLSEVPVLQEGKRTITYIDELAKKYKSRNFSSDDALAMTDELIELRHFDGSIIGGTQDPRLVDINYYTLSDIQVWKSYNLQNESLTREGVLTDLVKRLMPISGAIQKVLVCHKGEYSTFDFEFSQYSQDISKYLRELKTPEKRKQIIDYVSTYHQKQELKKILATQFSIRLTVEEQKKLL